MTMFLRVFRVLSVGLLFGMAACGGPEVPAEPTRPTTPNLGNPLVEGCNAGATKSCLKAAEDAQTRGDDLAAAELFDTACEQGDSLGCLMAGGAFLGIEGQQDRGTARLEQVCQRGELTACYGLGLAQEGMYGQTPDLSAAQQTYKGACDNGLLTACERVGVLMIAGGDAEGGRSVLQKNCDAGEGSSCHAWAVSRLRDNKPQETTAVLIKGCELGDGESCTELGFSQSKGRDAAKDDQAAAGSFQKGCVAAVPSTRGCAMAAWGKVQQGESGSDGVQDLERLCSAGEALGCFYRGRAAKASQGDSADWLKKACAADPRMCEVFTSQM